MQPKARPYLPNTNTFTSGADSPRAFLERCLAEYEAREPEVGAFVNINIAGARSAADRASERWKAGKPLSAIDGMPIGIKDIMETADMPTEQGSPLFAGWRCGRDAAAVAALREAGAVILGKTVTTEFAASEPRGTRNPWDLTRTPGGSSSGSAAAVACGMLPAALGTQVIGSILRPASYCGCVGYKPSVGAINRGGSFDQFSQSVSGVLAATVEEAWVVAREISARAGGDAGFVGLTGPLQAPSAKKPRALALFETAGFAAAAPAAKAALQHKVEALKSAGVAVLTRQSHPKVETLEGAIATARALSMTINAWEARWPLNTYARDMDRNKLSGHMQERLAQAEAMNQDDYRKALAERERVRAIHAKLAAECDACISLAAPDVAPVGLQSTGDPAFAVPSSLLGVPVLSLPLLQVNGLPLGLQVMGFRDADADLFATAAWIAALSQ
jgi:Asp-tRNA(Asn)/Glu-tRNA(Gln) amidotransferase A subunit family amidase